MSEEDKNIDELKAALAKVLENRDYTKATSLQTMGDIFRNNMIAETAKFYAVAREAGFKTEDVIDEAICHLLYGATVQAHSEGITAVSVITGVMTMYSTFDEMTKKNENDDVQPPVKKSVDKRLH